MNNALESNAKLSCPFCGGSTWVDHDPECKGSTLPRQTWVVVCRWCAAHGPWTRVSQAEAERLWDKRVAPKEGVE